MFTLEKMGKFWFFIVRLRGLKNKLIIGVVMGTMSVLSLCRKDRCILFASFNSNYPQFRMMFQSYLGLPYYNSFLVA